MIKEAIILAGGLGTRLRSVVSDAPKCMAMVAEKPFLHYVITYLQKQGVSKFIFSLGYMSEVIEDYLLKEFPFLNYQLSVENKPLGTGGAIKLACTKASEKNVLIVNGDTLFDVDIKKLEDIHRFMSAECTLALKPMEKFDRYGAVEINSNSIITSFKEKKYYKEGLINGGCYILNVSQFCTKTFPKIFSFEKDYLEKYVTQHKIYGQIHNAYFIDIGIPEDYEKAQTELIPYK
ncbi:MAG: nucleotidyltransferase family protein [Chitinophagaceae bacterium]|nr:nucleotidyltransferase family protein [Chitinophagaceae bacterium]